MKRRFFSIFLALCLCLTLLPTTALAADPTLGISVCGTEITLANKDNVLAGTPNDGKVRYDLDSHTLTLSGAALECESDDNGVIDVSNTNFPAAASLTIVLEGDNTITVKGPFGINSPRHVCIQGNGSLTISFDETTTRSKAYGISVSNNKNLTIESGATVTVNAGNVTVSHYTGTKSYGVHVEGNLTVNGTLNATAGKAKSTSSTVEATSYGVWTGNSTMSGRVTVGAGGSLTATGGEAENTAGGSAKSYGVYTYDGVTVGTGGSLDSTGGKATGNFSSPYYGSASSYGIYVFSNPDEDQGESGSVTVSGTLTATGGESSSPTSANSSGVHAKNVNVSGIATVNAGKATSTSTSTSNANSYGVYTSYGNVTVGGTLNVNTGVDAGKATSTSTSVHSSNTGRAYSYGVYTDNGTVTVNGTATVNAGDAKSIHSGDARSYGVLVERFGNGGNLMVNAGGRLTAKSGTVENTDSGNAKSCGVLVNGSSIAAEIHGTVDATGGGASGGSDPASYGLCLDANFASATLTVGATGSLTGTGGASVKSYGIYVSNSSDSYSETTVTLSGGTMLGQTKATLTADPDSGTDDGTSATASGSGTMSPTLETPATKDIGIYVDTNMTNADVDIKSGTVTGNGTNCGVYVKGTLKVGVGTEASVTLHAKSSTSGTSIYTTRTTTTEDNVTPLLLEVEPHAVSIVKPVGGSPYMQSTTTASTHSKYTTVLNDDDPASGVATEAILQRSYVAPVPDTPSYTPVITRYPVMVEDSAHGVAESDRAAAAAGTMVTITVAPDAGYRLSGLTAVDYRDRAVELVDRGNGVFTFTMPAGKVTVTATFAPTRTFTDVPPESWYFDAVTWAVGNEITTGVTSTTFEPALVCTRAQAVTFLYRAAKAAGVDVNVGEETNILNYNDALDIPEYAFEAFQWACNAGIVQGDNGNLLPNASCTRTHIVTFLWRFAQVIGMDMSVGEETNILSYNDALDIPEYAFEAFQWACGAGIVQGDNGNLLPNANCTRGQIVTMLYRMLGE